MSKRCSKCRIVRAEDEFPRNITKRDGLGATCKGCHRAYVRAHYQRNRDYYLAKALPLNRLHGASMRALLHELKAVPCTDCGQTYSPWIMEFDHVRGQKLFNLSEGLRGRRRSDLILEAAKREVVCANCHRDRTYRRIQSAGGSASVDPGKT